MAWSFAVHLAAALAFIFVPGEWWHSTAEQPDVMVISIAGSPGADTGGFNPLGSRVVEEVKPQPKRPEPVAPSTSKPAAAPVTVEPPKAPPKPPDSQAPPDPVAPPQATGTQVQQGTSKVETGVQNSQGTGLAQGGQGLGKPDLEVDNFCCHDWLDIVILRIREEWRPPPNLRGTTMVRFVINRDGTFRDAETLTPSGIGLFDRAAKSAILTVGAKKVPPIPPAHQPDFLAVRLTFVK
jgi:TonB family protein